MTKLRMAKATIPRVLASTTGHKHEPLLPTLELFATLGLHDVDLNLRPLVEPSESAVAATTVAVFAADAGLRIPVASGGWCDFFARTATRAAETDRSVARQVWAATQVGATQLRLFFGTQLRYTPTDRATIKANILRLSDRHPDMRFNFENHTGASRLAAVCHDIVADVDRPNIRLTYDPINFYRAQQDGLAALDVVRDYVAHVHLKGLDGYEFCEFGAGDVDLTPVLRALQAANYQGGFTVEYEGPHDRTLRLVESVKRARTVIAALFE